MIPLRPLAFSVIFGTATLPALAANPADELDDYGHKMDQCKHQMSVDHPDMASKDRKKACKAQLGPAPKGVVPAKAPAPVL